MNCPCGHKKDYTDCCLLFHTGKIFAKTAEQLMRSRYSAFVKNDLKYIKRTMISPALDDFSNNKMKFSRKKIVWLGLQILSTEKGLESDTEGWVKFQAEYKDKNSRGVMVEDSYFKKIDNKWFYASARDS